MSLLRHIDGDPCPRFGDELPAHKELPAHTSPELLAHTKQMMAQCAPQPNAPGGAPLPPGPAPHGGVPAAPLNGAATTAGPPHGVPHQPTPLMDTTKARGRGRPPQSEVEAALAEARRRAKNKERMAAKRKAKP
jgi:hypothetical protein